MPSDHDFSEIYDVYYPKILQYITKAVGPSDAEDLCQEVFDKVHRGLAEFRGRSRLSTWIYRIATNTIIDRSRAASYKFEKEQRASKEKSDAQSAGLAEDHCSPVTDQLVIRKEMSDCVNAFIDALPASYRTVLVLSEIEGMTNLEIAEILGISLDNVKIRLHRARAKLKEALQAGCDFYYNKENQLLCDRKQIQILPKPQK